MLVADQWSCVMGFAILLMSTRWFKKQMKSIKRYLEKELKEGVRKMKSDGYFLECDKCGSCDIKKSEPTTDNRTHKTKYTLTCLNCKRQVTVEK